MTPVIVALAAFLTSALTLFSGFGLGTLLMPVFAIFFPVELAIGMTAIVHLLNNVFKLGLIGRWADGPVILRFGIPAVIAAFAGAGLLNLLADLPEWGSYRMGGMTFQIKPLNTVIAALMILFAVVELLPAIRKLAFDKKYLPIGGVVSGLFGGLSGHQGAFRSAFLIRAGLSKEVFIASNVVIACMVDVSRLTIYLNRFRTMDLWENAGLLTVATLSAFAGAYLGSRMMEKITLHAVRWIVSILLFAIAIALGAGWI
jgi:uncharacterized membrane protein YfcA